MNKVSIYDFNVEYAGKYWDKVCFGMTIKYVKKCISIEGRGFSNVVLTGIQSFVRTPYNRFNLITISISYFVYKKIVSEYDQEIPQSQTADNPVAPRGRAAQPSRDTRKTN